MNRIVLLLLICCMSVGVSAQKNAPKWMDKARRAVVKITVYDKNNRESGTGFGFFVSESGEVLSGYTLFKGAERAVVTDFEGKEYPVTHIIGADEMYDVIRVQTAPARKPVVLAVASDPVPEGETIYHLGYSPGKESNFKQGTVTETSKLKEVYGYYQLDIPLSARQTNTPFVNSAGEVFGLAQEDASGKNEVSYAVSAAYTHSLVQTSVDIFNSAYRNIGIKKAWVPNVEDAIVSLFLLSGQLDTPAYLETINDFIATFPDVPDGYQSRANLYVTGRKLLTEDATAQQRYLDQAKADFAKAMEVSPHKSDVLYEQAKLIYTVALEEEEITDPSWTLDAASEIIGQAIQLEEKPLYRQLEGDIYMYKGEFDKAYTAYMVVNNSELATPISYYWAAKALENVPGANIGDMLALLDKAVELSGTSAEAGPYLLERIDKRLMLSQYDEALEDYDTYYYVVNGKVNDTFYYLREQVKFRKGDLEGALADIQEALKMDPENPDYCAEEASVYTRMQEYEKALASLRKALEIAPDFAACYRLQGVCYQRMERKNEACDAFQKAKELGDPLADKLIRDNCQ
ncbi:MAG: tetratricopeptide repeat protein [Tannerellaceae bacterium]|nr:tetratricopeptide repeat protein [Tannerellaceae bacterium]